MTAPVGRSARDQSARGTASWHMERRVLASLLRQPNRIETLGGALREQHFADPNHRAVFATIAGLHAKGWLRTIYVEQTSLAEMPQFASDALVRNQRDVVQALEAGWFTDAPRGDLATLVTDLTLAAARATQPPEPYARKVREMALRRDVETWGVALHNAAIPDQAADIDLSTLSDTVDAVMQNLSELVQDFRPSRDPADITTAPLRAVPAVKAAAPPPRLLVERAERDIIHAVLADPRGPAAPLLTRLRPEDFTALPEHRATWRAIQSLFDRNEPIDPLMVAWESEVLAASPAAPLDGRTALPAEALIEMSTTPAKDIAKGVSLVARASLSELARKGRDLVQNSAANRESGVGDAVSSVRDYGTGLLQEARRLVGTAAPTSSVARRLSTPATSTSAATPNTRTR